ncbi:SWIM zinc finger family protein [Nocardia veterana]|uniref:SWIM zinc finger family protein n=1 Tax=Nocardia veterana TaxID=132249 RepID=A0A7X6RHY5_9NOCA|nr:SWIM zinc finger family protein [Nocardia veterana]
MPFRGRAIRSAIGERTTPAPRRTAGGAGAPAVSADLVGGLGYKSARTERTGDHVTISSAAAYAVTADNVLALAPDAASVTAARKLTAAWLSTGRHDAALWGLCKGSGARPYQTIVDLSGPAYRCTCPSRKFPCKHALALLLLWSQGAVEEAGAPADFATEWLTARAARRTAPAEPATRDSKQSTIEQRRARVTTGLDDLDIWLGDQIRTGLAQSDHSETALEGVAARMVDSQAPGVAAALRQLPRRLEAAEQWPPILLSEYARLRLLIDAHRRLDEMPPALAQGIRAHIGYPVKAEDVRAAEPAVRDRWQVLAVRITEEERVFTRRTLLRGRLSQRWAQVVEHNFGSASFPGDLPIPGTMIDVDLHFYPAAMPLRALWGARHGGPEPFTTFGATATTIRDQLAAHARALGADPWLRGWPMMLPEVVPAPGPRGWYLAEPDGTALPIATTVEVPWQLIGVSGGRPLTVVGEWTAGGLLPLAALTAGELVDVEPESLVDVPGPGTAVPESSAALVPVALLGTARRVLDPNALAAPVAARVRAEHPEHAVLTAVALQELYHRGGAEPVHAELPEPAQPDEREQLPRAATERLRHLLADGSPMLAEWFDAALPGNRRAPDTLCAALLEHARNHAALRDPLLRLAGTRGRWLAALHPRWRPLLRTTGDDPQVWTHGRPAERRAWLAALRARDADAARTALSETWDREPARGRAELLAVLADGIGPGDEPLLESALDDTRPEVRRTAADLLARLPDSAFAGRMRDRAGRWVTVRSGALTAHLPRELDDSARRDGLGDRLDPVAYRRDGGADVDAERLRRLMAATPLGHWEALCGSPAAATALRLPDDILGPVCAGWSEAALAQRDPRWAGPLFEVLTTTPTLGADPRLRQELFALLPLDHRVRYLCGLDSSWLAELELLVSGLPRPWPYPVAEHLVRLLLDRAQLAAARPGAAGLSPASYRALLRTAAVNFPVRAAGVVAVAARRCADPYWQSAFDRLADDLTQRTLMLEELA